MLMPLRLMALSLITIMKLRPSLLSKKGIWACLLLVGHRFLLLCLSAAALAAPWAATMCCTAALVVLALPLHLCSVLDLCQDVMIRLANGEDADAVSVDAENTVTVTPLWQTCVETRVFMPVARGPAWV